MTEHPSLAAALAAFQAEMPTVHKGKTADTGTYRYSYADLADVVAAGAPVLTRHGLSFLTKPRRTDAGPYELVGVLLHTSGEREEGALPLHGSNPQQLGSAITYARRYLFGCMTGIVTDDDDDGARAQQARPTTVDRNQQARTVFARAQQAEDLAAIQRLWHESDARGLLDEEVADYEGTLEPLGAALRRYGDRIQARDARSRSTTGQGDTGQGRPPVSPPGAGSEVESRQPPSPADSPSPPRSRARMISRAQQRMMLAQFGGPIGLAAKHTDRAARLDYCSRIIGRTVESSDDLTSDEASRVIDTLAKVETRDALDGLLAGITVEEPPGDDDSD